MPSDNTTNIIYADALAKLAWGLIGKAEKANDNTTKISLAQLNSLYAGVSRLSMVERHLHNITSGAYTDISQ